MVFVKPDMIHRDLIRSTYDQNATQFVKTYNSLSTDKVLPGLADRLPTFRALDIGCGGGRDAKWLAQKGFRVDAIDISEGMLREAEATNLSAKQKSERQRRAIF